MKAIRFISMLMSVIRQNNPNVGNAYNAVQQLYGYSIVTPNDFDKKWTGDQGDNGFIAQIDKEKTSYNTDRTGVIIIFKPNADGSNFFKNKNYLELTFDGRYRTSPNSKFESVNHRGRTNALIKINIINRDKSVERLIAIANDIIDGCMLNTYAGISVNMLDGSGNINTAEYLGIPRDYSLDNLELTFHSDNIKHGARIKKLYEITGHVYRVSANDSYFDKIYNTNSTDINKYDIIRNYCSQHFYKVK